MRDARRLAPPGSVTLREPPEGEIRGALGTIRPDDAEPRRSLARRLLTLLAIMGPGLVVMIGDNDAGGVTTYAQAGQAYGTSLLWTLVLLVPVLVVAQEMVARLGAVTGVGHARLIRERFGRFWAAFSVVDLFVLNALTLMTEFIGIDLGLRYFGVSDYLSVPLAAVGMVGIAASGSFRRWERSMLVLIALSLLMYPLAALSHPRIGPVLHGLVVPSVAGGWTSSAVLFVIAIVGTTVAPWQLFFQQSNVIDKRITTRWLRYEVAETVIGGFLTNIGAAALVVAAAFAFAGTKLAGQQSSGLGLAEGFAHTLGHAAGALFAVVLIDAALIGGSAVTLSSAYAFADLFGIRHSLHRRVREAKGFYATYAAMVAVSAGVVLVPHAPLGLINLAVQVLAGTLLPSAIVFLLLLANDPAVLGPYVNTPRQNAVASVIVAVLVLLSLLLTVSSLLPSLPLGPVGALLAGLAVAGLAVAGFAARRQRDRLVVREAVRALDRTSWRMPPIKTLPPLAWSPTRKLAMLALRAYLVLAAIAMVVKVVELAH